MNLRYLPGVTTLSLQADACTGCRVCTQVCPSSVFEMDGPKVRLADRDGCIECGACALNCPFGALKVRAGVGCAAGILNGMLGRESACCVIEDDGEQDGQCC